MSLDRIHDISGLMQFAAQPVLGSTGTAQTIASNQYPGGYQLGAYEGRLAGSNSTNGGAVVAIPVPRGQATTDFYNIGTTATTLNHENAAVMMVSASATNGAIALQPASLHGQCLTIVNASNAVTVITGVTTTGFGGTTTAACRNVDAQLAIAASSGAVLQAFAQLGGTATTNLSFVWHRIA